MVEEDDPPWNIAAPLEAVSLLAAITANDNAWDHLKLHIQ